MLGATDWLKVSVACGGGGGGGGRAMVNILVEGSSPKGLGLIACEAVLAEG